MRVLIGLPGVQTGLNVRHAPSLVRYMMSMADCMQNCFCSIVKKSLSRMNISRYNLLVETGIFMLNTESSGQNGS